MAHVPTKVAIIIIAVATAGGQEAIAILVSI
jgi:hypothetical protein